MLMCMERTLCYPCTVHTLHTVKSTVLFYIYTVLFFDCHTKHVIVCVCQLKSKREWGDWVYNNNSRAPEIVPKLVVCFQYFSYYYVLHWSVFYFVFIVFNFSFHLTLLCPLFVYSSLYLPCVLCAGRCHLFPFVLLCFAFALLCFPFVYIYICVCTVRVCVCVFLFIFCVVVYQNAFGPMHADCYYYTITYVYIFVFGFMCV